MAEPYSDDLTQAAGLAVSLIGSLLEGANVVPRGDFAQHLANLAAVTHETNPNQGDILDRWATLSERVGNSRSN